MSSTTPPMLVQPPAGVNDNTITFHFKPKFPGPLFLSSMSITRNPSVASVPGVSIPVTGPITPGKDGTHGGFANLDTDPAGFNILKDFVNSHNSAGLSVQLKFDGLTALEVTCSATTQPQPAASLSQGDIAP